ncbi:unnamed protein product [Caenorhabditis brenneri]
MANSFSLLRLPKEERLQVLRCMDRMSLLFLSLLSRKTKDLIRSLRLKPITYPRLFSLIMPPVQIGFSDTMGLLMRCWDISVLFYKEPQDNMKMLEKPNKVWIYCLSDARRTTIELQNSMEIREWYEHILYIINETRQATQMILYQESDRFDMEVAKTVFGKINHLTCFFSRPDNHGQDVVRIFGSDLKQLALSFNPYPLGDTRLRKILIQNLDKLGLGGHTSFERLNLEDLLICNAQYIKFSVNEQFDNINQFLKIWIKGANSRLQNLTIEQRIPFNPEQILKGIKIHREIPIEQNIVYGTSFDWRFARRTRAVDIERYDVLFVMANSFSLLRLPNEERLQVLRCLDARSLLFLSLISRKTKDLVKSVQINRSRFHVVISQHIALDMPLYGFYLHFYKEPQNNMEMLVKPSKVWISHLDFSVRRFQNQDIELSNHFELREWYEHILYILNIRQATQIDFYEGCERFDLGAIKTVFGKLDTIFFNFREPRDHVRAVLRTFLPDLKELRLLWNPYPQGDTRLQKILMQNFNELDLGNHNLFERLNLKDLLICNAHHIRFSLNQQFDNINQFLKLWVKGSNKRLQKLIIEQRTRFKPKEILKGIKIHREIPREENIVCGEIFDFRFAYRTRAVDIKRYDGTRGTIIFIRSYFYFLVWS